MFKKAGTQGFTSGGSVGSSIGFTVNSGATLNAGTSVIGGGSFTLSSGAGLMIGSAVGITTSGATGNVQSTTRTFSNGANYIYSGGAAQVTGNGLPTTVNDLTINNAAGVTLSANVTVNGVLTLANGAFGIGANTLTVNDGSSVGSGSLTSAATGTVSFAQGSAGQAVLPGTFGNLIFSNFNKTLPSGTILIAGTFTPGNATGHTVANSTIQFNGSATQTIPAFTYHHLQSTNTGARTLASSGVIKIAGTWNPGANSTTVTGSTIEMNGSAAQALPAAITSYNHLTVNNAAGVSLGGPTTVSGTLALTTGTLSTGADVLTLGSAGSVARTGGHVVGSFRKSVTTGSPTVTFEIGRSGAYLPLTVAFTGVTTGGTLTASAIAGDHAAIAGSGLDAARSVNDYWTLANGGLVFGTYAATFGFVSGDVDAGASTGSFIVRRYSAPSWTSTTTGTRTATSTQATGITGFGDFAVAEILPNWTITASASANGSISPSGSVVVVQGGSAAFTITPSRTTMSATSWSTACLRVRSRATPSATSPPTTRSPPASRSTRARSPPRPTRTARSALPVSPP